MDPATIGAVLAAVAGGAEDALGGQVWNGVSALVRRPFRHAQKDSMVAVTSGEAEMAALIQEPASSRRAVALAEVLVSRARTDGGFAAALAAWWEQACQVQVTGDVANTISGGTQHGPVVQGRDFTGLAFGVPVSSPESASAGDSPEGDRRP